MMYKRERAFLSDQMGATVKNLLRETGAFLAGGAVTSVFSSEKINDFDVFFRDAAGLESGLKLIEADGETIETDAARSKIIDGHRVQLIKCVTGDLSRVIAGFDFTICQAAFDLDDGFVFSEEFFYHLAQRKLVFNINAKYPICSLYRARKFIKRGFNFSGIEAIKLGLRIQSLRLDTYAELRRQLMGIDTMFLKDLTDALKGQEEKHYEFNSFMELLNDHLDKLDAVTGGAA